MNDVSDLESGNIGRPAIEHLPLKKLVYLGLKATGRVEEDPKVLAPSGAGAERMVNARVVVDAILGNFREELGLPISSGQVSPFLENPKRMPDVGGVKATLSFVDTWGGQRTYLPDRKSLMERIQIAQSRPLATNENPFPGIDLAFSEDYSQTALRTANIAGTEGQGVLKSMIRELGRYADLPQGRTIEDWLKKHDIRAVRPDF